ncbi:polyketide synthase dehydratase domain-containing protein [Streptomyces sp. GKU 257-1]|nr:polyketide synthase dehydratase domain-containing protein [Streptomyces sp. GKU 257-1]
MGRAGAAARGRRAAAGGPPRCRPRGHRLRGAQRGRRPPGPCARHPAARLARTAARRGRRRGGTRPLPGRAGRRELLPRLLPAGPGLRHELPGDRGTRRGGARGAGGAAPARRPHRGRGRLRLPSLAALDAALQTAGRLASAAHDPARPLPYLPFSLGSVRLHAALPQQLFAHATPAAGPRAAGTLCFDVALLDRTGAVVATLDAFTLRELPRTDAAGARRTRWPRSNRSGSPHRRPRGHRAGPSWCWTRVPRGRPCRPR